MTGQSLAKYIWAFFQNVNTFCSICLILVQTVITRSGYQVPGMISLQARLYTYSLLRGVTFEVLPLSIYELSLTMLPSLETFLELLVWNSFQSRRHISLDVFSILKSSSL